jgi:UDP-glucose 4-epimerase
MKAVVFGGSGFLGSHVADALSEAGHDVTLFDIRPSPHLRPGQRMIVGDILDSRAVAASVLDADYVYNFAGIADLNAAETRPLDTITANVLGNAIILEAARSAGIKRYIYASTIYVYSNAGGFYRCSKQASESYIEEYARTGGPDFTILRYGTLYGPRADACNSVYRYLRQALTTGRIETSGTGDERREYIHVRDAARLSVEILSSEHANTHITITGLQSHRYKDLLNMIREIMGGAVEIVYNGSPAGAHYALTPYSYTPRSGLKLVSPLFTDLGQGLLECIEDIDCQCRQERKETCDKPERP